MNNICKLSYALIYLEHHTYGKIRFIDKNDEFIQNVEVLNTNISPNFYDCDVEYKELLPTSNPYPDEVVSQIKFIDLNKQELIAMKGR